MADRPRDLAERMANASRPPTVFCARLLPCRRLEARQKAREFFDAFPKAAYMSEVESWRELPGDRIEFTLKRLPSAD